jgi:hypothetical protein
MTQTPDEPTFDARASADAARDKWLISQGLCDQDAAQLLRTGGSGSSHQPLVTTALQNHNAYTSDVGDLTAALNAEPKLFADHNTDPIVLLPVRLETTWFTADGQAPPNTIHQPTLRVRVYPDDVALAHLDTTLTATEAAAGQQYWQAPGPNGWAHIQSQLRPDRAAWAVRACRPGAPTPTVRPVGSTRPTQSVLMPSRWRFVAFTDGNIVADQIGRDIPDPLPLDLLQSEQSWTVHWFPALVHGMAIELALPEGVDHVDALFVVGVRDGAATDGAAYLTELLQGHAYSSGLAFLPAGTPTNNTAESRSGWSSTPGFPDPTDSPAPGSRPRADALAAALGLSNADVLQHCQGADDTEPEAVAALSVLTWPTLGAGFATAAASHVRVANDASGGGVTAVDPLAPYLAVRDHLVSAVRSRGPLPAIRVGRQPYGVLPVSSLSDWQADRVSDPDVLLLPWLLQLRMYWQVTSRRVPNIESVDAQAGVDEVIPEILRRQATAAAVTVSRMSGPTATMAAVAGGAMGSPLTFAGLPADSALWWTTPAAEAAASPEAPVDLVQQLTGGHDAFSAAAANTADYLHTVSIFLSSAHTVADAQAYDSRWPVDRGDGQPARQATLIDVVGTPTGVDMLNALVCIRNWSDPSLTGDPIAAAFGATAIVDQAVSDLLTNGTDDSAPQIADAAKSAGLLAELETAMRAVAALPVARVTQLLTEVIDVYTHRLDAWITSLATRRLGQLRATSTVGARIGGYGWVENLAPMAPRETVQLAEGQTAIMSAQDGYIHAPSLQQATAAAVLRSGALTHPGQDAYSINLNSARSRVARWLINGVRQGQTLGALLGYRFERALHEAHLDNEIPAYRVAYPIPTTADPTGTGAAADASHEAVAARNVVDGLKLVHDGGGSVTASNPGAVAPLIKELAATLDAVSDLLLAESVHQLVTGNTARAGLTADTLGRGGEVPDRFATLTTPHRARGVTHRLIAVLPSAASGWPADDLARLAPELEAWVGQLLGPAAGWTIVGAADAGTPTPITLDQLQLGALSTALDAASAGQPALSAAFLRVTAAPPAQTVSFTAAGWQGLCGMASRIRALLAAAQPLLPAALPEPETRSLDLTDVRLRLVAFAGTPAVAAHPRGPALLAAANTIIDDPQRWLATARPALAEVLGAEVPLLPTVSGAAPTARPDVKPSDLDAWLVRYAQVRPVARTLYDTLLLAGLRAKSYETLRATQYPTSSGDSWIGSVYGAGSRPAADSHLVWHQPIASAGPLAGVVFDEWVELLPGADQLRQLAPGVAPLTSPPQSELTGITFHYDRPDAKAVQALLVAVPPNLDRGWTPDTLLQVLRETLELSKLRGVELADLQAMQPLLPAIRIPAVNNAAGNILGPMAAQVDDGHDDSPLTLNTSYRTPLSVETGLAARLHDPLWMLTRQWQFGEFAAQDAGSPAMVNFEGKSQLINAWRPLGASDWVSYDPTATPLDVAVEAEAHNDGDDELLRTELGAHFRALLTDTGQLSTFSAQLSGMAMPVAPVDDSTVGLISAVGGSVPDPDALDLAIGSGGFAQEGIQAVADQWTRWRDQMTQDHRPDCFDPTRFEHSAEISVGGVVLRADSYLGDGLDWYYLDVDPDTAAAPPAAAYTFTDETALPSVVRYSGLPADRFWEMEDAQVDLGAAEVTGLDTGRLLLISFATVYGNDWFLAPLEVPIGSLTTLDQMLVRDVFDRHHVINRAGRDDAAWSMFTLDSSDPDHWAATGLLVMPCVGGQPGQPLEHVGLTRDELANLGWAVQHRVTDSRGRLIDCRDRWLKVMPAPEQPDGQHYRVQTVVPDYWFPLVPLAVSPGLIHFTLGQIAAPDSGTALLPNQAPGQLITDMSWIHEEELPREGAAVVRRPVLARWFDGSWYSWIRREKSAGTGESSSGLLFDSVWPTIPWPQ